jgi:hypothetical protein
MFDQRMELQFNIEAALGPERTDAAIDEHLLREEGRHAISWIRFRISCVEGRDEIPFARRNIVE